MEQPLILSVQTGTIAPLGPARVPSGFVKQPRPGTVPIGSLGLAGDAQADLTVHGGPEKAVYAYAAAHYARWRADFPALAAQFGPGAMGENLTIGGMEEADLRVGDVHAIGSARLQVCQPRQPCFKLALRFGEDRLPSAMLTNGRAGWYYRVLQAGTVTAGDAVLLIERPQPGFAFSRLVEIVYRGNAEPDELAALSTMTEVASGIRAKAARRLARG